jgi:hypothetical protein
LHLQAVGLPRVVHANGLKTNAAERWNLFGLASQLQRLNALLFLNGV